MTRAMVWTLVVALMIAVPALAQTPPPIPRLPQPIPVVGPIVDQVLNATIPPMENATGNDLTHERIDVYLLLDLRDADFAIVQILFGGGKISLDAKVTLSLDFYAVSAERLDQALQQATGAPEANIHRTFGVNTARTAFTAEEIRLMGGGALLAAFQALEANAARRLLESTIPGSTVISADVKWTHVFPGERLRDGQDPTVLRDPPIHLEATFAVNYIDRYSVLDIAGAALKEKSAEAKESAALKERIAASQEVPASQQTAFMMIGYSQLVAVEVPPGWRLGLEVRVPKGYAIESVSQAMHVSDDRRAARYSVDGDERVTAFESAGVATLSNRFLVTSTLAALTLALGLVGRFLTEGGVLTAEGLWGRQSKRRRSKAAEASSSTPSEVAPPPTSGQTTGPTLQAPLASMKRTRGTRPPRSGPR